MKPVAALKCGKWEHVLVRVIDESPFLEEAIWEKEDEGFELVTAYSQDGCVRLYFKRARTVEREHG